MRSLILPGLVSVAAGVSVLVQQVLKDNLRAELNSAVWSGFVSYFLGLLCMVRLAVVFRDPIRSANVIARMPWWAWSGGVFGAIFIALAILLILKLGGATFIALLVAGQMLAALTF